MPLFNPFSALKEKIHHHHEKHEEEQHQEELKNPEHPHQAAHKKHEDVEIIEFFEQLKNTSYDDYVFNGTLLVSIIAASKLYKETRLGMVDSDPYLVVFIDGVEKARTSIKKGLDVEFKEYFEIPLSGKYNTISFQLFDSDAFSDDDFRGEVRLLFKDLFDKHLLKGPSPLTAKPVPKLSAEAPIGTPIQGELNYTVTFKSAPLDGHLSIHIDKAEGTEGEGLVLGSADAYVSVLLDSILIHKTGVKTADNPVWNDKFDLDVAGEHTNLYLGLWDKDLISRDDYLGHVTVPVRDIIAKKNITLRAPVLQYRTDKLALKSQGFLSFNINWTPPHLDGNLSVKIVKGAELLESPGWGIPLVSTIISPAVEVLLDGVSKAKTKHVKTRNPEWNETFQFATNGPQQVLELVVWNAAGWVSAAESLGCLRISAQQLVAQKTVKGEFFLIPYKVSNASGTLSVEITYTKK